MRTAGPGPTLAVVSLGGAAGALARHGVGLALPGDPGTFPLGTFLVNVAGCLLLGVLVVVVTERPAAHPLVRPFLAAGVLGGFTTFSSYALEADGLLRVGEAGTAVGYLVGTLVAALVATRVGIGLARVARPGRA